MGDTTTGGRHRRDGPARGARAGALALALAIGLAAGCGGGSGRLSIAEYRERADAICTTANSDLARLGEPGSAADLEMFLRAGLAIGRTELGDLRALAPPAKSARDHDAATALIDRQLGIVEAALGRLDDGEDPVDVLMAAERAVGDLDERADARARALGLRVCGAGPGPAR